MLELRRKLAHLVLGTLFAFLVVSLPHALIVTINLLLIASLLVSAYLYQVHKVRFFVWLFERFDRPGKFTARGALTFFVGTLAAVLLFSPFVAAVSILVLAIGDAAATIAGYYAGKHSIVGNKTLEGTLAFFVSTGIVLAFFLAPVAAISIALVTAILELVTPSYIDDNLILPVATGILLSI
ncbi:MAG: diacylglycerol/polyprenol kinase family protein [Halobacteriota archaeon]